MIKFRRTESEIHNFKKIVDHKGALGELAKQKHKIAFEKMLNREGFPTLEYFESLNDI